MYCRAKEREEERGRVCVEYVTLQEPQLIKSLIVDCIYSM